jgi:parallel beta-helix repeat protein
MLKVNNEEIEKITIPFFPRYTIQNVSFTWVPPDIGAYTVAVNVTIPGVPEEYYGDNEKTEQIFVGVQNLNTEECFATIQKAIDDPDTRDGHRIFVPSGLYYENVVVEKNLSLLGDNLTTTVIIGKRYTESTSGSATIYVKETKYVNITGFTIQNGIGGISLVSSLNTTIANTIVSNNIYGVQSVSCSNTVIKDTILSDNTLRQGYFLYPQTMHGSHTAR